MRLARVVVMTYCGDVAESIAFLYTDTPPYGGQGCLGDGLQSGKYML